MRVLIWVAMVAAVAVLVLRWASASADQRTRVVDATPDAILSLIEADARGAGFLHVSTGDQGEVYEQIVPVAVLKSESKLRGFAAEGDLRIRLAVDRPARAVYTLSSSGSKSRFTFGIELKPIADGKTTEARFRIEDAVAADGRPIDDPNDIARYPMVNALAKRTLRVLDGA